MYYLGITRINTVDSWCVIFNGSWDSDCQYFIHLIFISIHKWIKFVYSPLLLCILGLVLELKLHAHHRRTWNFLHLFSIYIYIYTHTYRCMYVCIYMYTYAHNIEIICWEKFLWNSLEMMNLRSNQVFIFQAKCLFWISISITFILGKFFFLENYPFLVDFQKSLHKVVLCSVILLNNFYTCNFPCLLIIWLDCFSSFLILSKISFWKYLLVPQSFLGVFVFIK